MKTKRQVAAEAASVIWPNGWQNNTAWGSEEYTMAWRAAWGDVERYLEIDQSTALRAATTLAKHDVRPRAYIGEDVRKIIFKIGHLMSEFGLLGVVMSAEEIDRVQKKIFGETVPEVEFCTWCPTPSKPSEKFHPNGSPIHQE